MNYSVWAFLAGLVLVVMGCSTTYQQLLSPLTWREVQESAEVTFGEPVLEGQLLSIPLHVERKPNDSLHVLCFHGEVSDARILVSGQLYLPDKAPPPEERRSLKIELSEPLKDQYSLVYENPDGSTISLRSLDVQKKNPSSLVQPVE